MKLIHNQTNQYLEGVIEQAKPKDLEALEKGGRFIFDWETEKEYEVYKIRLKRDKQILGLLSLIDIPKELRVHINLLESSQENVGKTKAIKNIPGCLIAHACRIAYERGYDGFVSLTPKTKLIDYYIQAYGFVPMGNQLTLFLDSSRKLIFKYLYNEES